MMYMDSRRIARAFLSVFLFCATAAATPVLAQDMAGGPPDMGREHSMVSRQAMTPQACHGPQSGWKKKHHGMRGRIRYALKQLDLTDAQKASIHQIRLSTKKDMIQKRADLKIARLELREKLRTDKVEIAAVESQVKKVEGLRSSLMLDRIKAFEQIKSTLTPEQRKKFADIMQDPGMQDFHGEGRMHPRG